MAAVCQGKRLKFRLLLDRNEGVRLGLGGLCGTTCGSRVDVCGGGSRNIVGRGLAGMARQDAGRKGLWSRVGGPACRGAIEEQQGGVLPGRSNGGALHVKTYIKSPLFSPLQYPVVALVPCSLPGRVQ